MQTSKIVHFYGRRFSRSCFSGCSREQPLNNMMRSAQAVESFRSSFYKGAKNELYVSTADIEDCMINNKVRPSAILPVFEVVGATLGFSLALLPKDAKEIATRIIDNATSQQLNDGIRNIQTLSSLTEDETFDVKETLKFHRDIRSSKTIDNMSSTENSLTLSLYNVLRISEHI